MLKKALVIALLFIAYQSFSQTFKVSAILKSKSTNERLAGASAQLKSVFDSSRIYQTVSDANGILTINNVLKGPYTLTIKYIGFEPNTSKFFIRESVDLGEIYLTDISKNLKEATIEAKAIRAEQLKDTIQYNADAFKVNRDATAEDLVKKMPGITNENGVIKSGGEEIKKVLVDGKEFFGDDPGMALKNLPAEVIDKVQVFDRLSEQSQFTKFDDGNSQKTINITSRRGKANGVFGKIYAGYGTDSRYNAGASLNFFNGNRRVTFLGMTNNVNQQNFSFQDLMGISGNASRTRGGMGSMMMRSGNQQAMRYMGGSEMANFMVGQNNGVAATNAIGANYTDIWFKKVNVQGSYFFNQTNTVNEGSTRRTFFVQNLNGQLYDQNDNSKADNFNHRVNFRFQYDIDSNNRFIYTPKFSLQEFNTTSIINGLTYNATDTLNKTENTNFTNSTAYNFSNTLMWQHRFAKAGRTFSTALQADFNNRWGNGNLKSNSLFGGAVDSSFSFDQISDNSNRGYTYGTNLVYTEPLGKKSLVQINYNPTTTYQTIDNNTFKKPQNSNEYTLLDSLLSSNYNNTYNRHRTGLSYQFNNDTFNLTIGADLQIATLTGNQIFPAGRNITYNYNNLLPNLSVNYKPNREVNMRFIYRTGTNIPSVQQLQPLVDNSNSVQLSSGNPNLDQSFNHTVILRYGKTKANGKTLFIVSYNNFTQNYIGNQTIIPTSTTRVALSSLDSITLRPGTQLSRPVNLDGNISTRAFINYGLPVSFIKSNLNFSLGYNYNRNPGLINDLENIANTIGVFGGFIVGSNISEKIDFTITYNNNYNIVKNSLQPQLDNTYINQNINGKLNLLIKNSLVVNSDISHVLFSGLSQSFNQQFILWNAAIGYKFLKDKQGELRLSVFDLLNQNNNISRNVTETYIEDQRTLILRQYFLITFTYNLRYFRL